MELKQWYPLLSILTTKLKNKFKKEIISKQPSYRNIVRENNSLNKFIQTNKKESQIMTDFKIDSLLMRNTSVTKISKIEYQVKRHWLKKKTKVEFIKLFRIETGENTCFFKFT